MQGIRIASRILSFSIQKTRKYTIMESGKKIASKKLGEISDAISSSVGPLKPVTYSVHEGIVQVSKLEGHNTIPRIQHKEYKGSISSPVDRGFPPFDEKDALAGKDLFGIPDCNFSKKTKEWTLLLQHFTGTPTGELEIGKSTNVIRPKTTYQGGRKGNLVSFDLHTATAQSIVEKTQKSSIDHSELIFVPVNHPAIQRFKLIKDAVKNIEIQSELPKKSLHAVLRKHGRSEFETVLTLNAIIRDKEDGVFCIHEKAFSLELPMLNDFFSKSVPQSGSFCLRKTSKRDEFDEPIFKLVKTKYTTRIDDEFEMLEVRNS